MLDAVEKGGRSLDAFYDIKGHEWLGPVASILQSPGGVEIKRGVSRIIKTRVGIRFQYHTHPYLFFR
jgi:hypothetical protein